MKNSLTISNIFKCTQKEFDEHKQKDLIPLICKNCDGEYVRLKKNILSNFNRDNNMPMFCSTKCFGEDKTINNIINVTCKQCNTKFDKTKSKIKDNNFCSSSCSAKYNNINRKPKVPKPLTKKCNVDNCTNIVRNKRSLLCDEHYNKKYGDKTKGEMIYELHKASAYSHIRCRARTRHKNIMLLGCAKCGYDKHVELCHIKGISEFDDSEYEYTINDISNVIQLCPNCHWEFDNLDRTPFVELLLKHNKIMY